MPAAKMAGLNVIGVVTVPIPTLGLCLIFMCFELVRWVLVSLRFVLNLLAWPARGAVSALGLVIALLGLSLELQTYWQGHPPMPMP